MLSEFRVDWSTDSTFRTDGVASIQRTLDNLKAGQAKQQSTKATGGSSKSAGGGTGSGTASAAKGDTPKSSGSVGGGKKK